MSFAELCHDNNAKAGCTNNPIALDAYNFAAYIKPSIKSKLKRDSYKSAGVCNFELRKLDKNFLFTGQIVPEYNDEDCNTFWFHTKELIYKHLLFLGFSEASVSIYFVMCSLDSAGEREIVNWDDYTLEDQRRIYDIEFEVEF
jgi:hypothetical protein